MHEEPRISINKKGNTVFFKQDCSCYNRENCISMVSAPSTFISMASFTISSSSNIIQQTGTASLNTCEKKCNVGGNLKKHCCVPSISLSSTSFSNGENCNIAASSGTCRFGTIKQINGCINVGNASEKVVNNTYQRGDCMSYTCKTTSNTNISHTDGICCSKVHVLSQEDEKNRIRSYMDIDNIDINSIHDPKATTYECENTYSGGSMGVLVGSDADHLSSSISTSNPVIPPTNTTNISKPSNICNITQISSRNLSLIYERLYDRLGPVMFPVAPLKGIKHPRGELRLWPTNHDRVISQNSSKRKVHRSLWIPQNGCEPSYNDSKTSEAISAYPMALKFVEDGNARDGRSIKREIECHLYIYQRLSQLQQDQGYNHLEDAWPCAELIGYYLDKKNPGNSVLVTRKLSGPDFFDIIRSEHSSSTSSIYSRCQALYEYNKLQWCTLALTRIAQYSALGIRHNDIKPDNIVLDFYCNSTTKERHLDVKIIDLGTASMHSAKDFTGGTSWYESPEQKMLEYYTKKSRDLKSAKMVEIGLSSDSWGAGISIAEVLMGRRVVDSMKSPYGPGPLEFKGKDGWLIDPHEWIEFAKMALGFDNLNNPYKYKICEEAAKYIFSMLVQVNANKRANIKDVVQRMDYYTQKAYQAVKQRHDV
ncbi:Ser/Thr protein kinase [Cryptosporidium canis]|uniref:Ser/Thr protein kinase n=1 Tax=Cryptosporidium canis TaxID=195482 RepID=A0A9D5DM02_9CRYT|nr:Ser/Thr protein kinase [Cryptosporidium canis]